MPEILSLNNQHTDSPPLSSSVIGEIGEKLAARFLIKNGYRLVMSNFKVPIGRNNRGATVTGEIDLIAFDENVLCFVEVKTRSSDEFASPLAAVDLRKQRQIIRAAKVYRKTFRLFDISFRYDAVSIVLLEKQHPAIELFKNFWTESKFRKKSWSFEFW
jgi:putative endonuclease